MGAGRLTERTSIFHADRSADDSLGFGENLYIAWEDTVDLSWTAGVLCRRMTPVHEGSIVVSNHSLYVAEEPYI